MTGRPSAERADCPVCGLWEVALRPRDGALMRHNDPRTKQPCQGWLDKRQPNKETPRGRADGVLL